MASSQIQEGKILHESMTTNHLRHLPLKFLITIFLAAPGLLTGAPGWLSLLIPFDELREDKLDILWGSAIPDGGESLVLLGGSSSFRALLASGEFSFEWARLMELERGIHAYNGPNTATFTSIKKDILRSGYYPYGRAIWLISLSYETKGDYSWNVFLFGFLANGLL